jgi:hypothetical protein
MKKPWEVQQQDYNLLKAYRKNISALKTYKRKLHVTYSSSNTSECAELLIRGLVKKE